MNTNIKFVPFSLPTSLIIKQSKDTGVSMLLTMGSINQSYTLVGRRAMPELVKSEERTTLQKPVGFTEVGARAISDKLTEVEFDGIPSPCEIASVITSVSLKKYL